MQLQQNFGGVIWTNHALERLADRRMSQPIALSAFKNPDTTNPGKQQGTTEFCKQVGPNFVTIIATKNEKGQWVIVSCWADPPFPGSTDIPKQQAYRNYRNALDKASGWGKLWIEIKHQLGLKQRAPKRN